MNIKADQKPIENAMRKLNAEISEAREAIMNRREALMGIVALPIVANGTQINELAANPPRKTAMVNVIVEYRYGRFREHRIPGVLLLEVFGEDQKPTGTWITADFSMEMWNSAKLDGLAMVGRFKFGNKGFGNWKVLCVESA